MYKITLLNKGVVLRTISETSLSAAEDVYYQFCSLPSVRAGYNTAKLEIEEEK